MLYLPVLGFALLSIIRLFQSNGTECIIFTALAGLYLIPATIQSIYEQWVQKKALEYKTLSEAFEKWANDLKEKQKEQEKKI